MPSIEQMLMTFAGLSGACRLVERRVQRLRQEEGRLDVEVHDLVPAAARELLEVARPTRRRHC